LTSSPLAEPLPRDKRPARFVNIYRNLVRDRPGLSILFVVDFEFDRFTNPLRANAFEAPAAARVTRFLYPEAQAIGKKTEGVKKCAFAHAIFANYHCKRSEWLLLALIPEPAERYVVDGAVVSHPKAFNTSHEISLSLSATGEAFLH
jgi:hypothetical protein